MGLMDDADNELQSRAARDRAGRDAAEQGRQDAFTEAQRARLEAEALVNEFLAAARSLASPEDVVYQANIHGQGYGAKTHFRYPHIGLKGYLVPGRKSQWQQRFLVLEDGRVTSGSHAWDTRSRRFVSYTAVTRSSRLRLGPQPTIVTGNWGVEEPWSPDYFRRAAVAWIADTRSGRDPSGFSD